jgi:hypothetical protein
MAPAAPDTEELLRRAVGDDDACGRPPQEERAAWARLWADMAGLLARSKESMPKEKEKPDKQ